jgi:hypothetical protein
MFTHPLVNYGEKANHQVGSAILANNAPIGHTEAVLPVKAGICQTQY